MKLWALLSEWYQMSYGPFFCHSIENSEINLPEIFAGMSQIFIRNCSRCPTSQM